MINWFGPESWGAPVCADAPRCEIPVGIACGRCRRPIGDADAGITMPGSEGPVTFHLACHLKNFLPHTRWPAAGLVPDETDGLVDGQFACRSCGMLYIEGLGWNGPATRPRVIE